MLTLELRGADITGRAYTKATRAFLNLIEAVADDVTRQPGSVETLIEVSQGSVNLHVHTIRKLEEAPRTEQIEAIVFDGLNQIEQVSGRPVNFNNNALRNISVLASVLRDSTYPIEGVTISTNGQRLEVTSHSEIEADQLLKSDYHDFGSVEGRLQTISERRGDRIYVFDDLTDKKVQCTISPDLRQEALNYFGRRVEARGLIRYLATGEPTSIRIEELNLIEIDGELPAAADVLGILEGRLD